MAIMFKVRHADPLYLLVCDGQISRKQQVSGKDNVQGNVTRDTLLSLQCTRSTVKDRDRRLYYSTILYFLYTLLTFQFVSRC